MLNGILEVAKRASKGGKVPIKIALLKIHTDINETNENGLHWNKEYVTNASESAKMIPICAEFCDDTKSVPFGHGLTGEARNAEGLDEPLFENSDVVGVIESTSVENIQIKDTEVLALVGSGYLYNQRYPKLVKWVRDNYALGTVDTSIEIMGTAENNNKIVYLEGTPAPEYRTPKEFVFTGTAILSVAPADTNAIVLEVAEKKVEKEDNKMGDNELKALIQNTIAEACSKNDELTAKITELNETITSKDSEIAELNASVEKLQKDLDDAKKEQEGAVSEREALEKQLGEMKTSQKLAELNTLLKKYTEDEQAFASNEINAFKEKPLEGDLSEIKSKICVGIVEKQKSEEKTSEINSAKEETVEDIFAEMCSVEDKVSDGDVSIF